MGIGARLAARPAIRKGSVILFLAIAVIVAGCVGQSPGIGTSTGDLSVRAISDPARIRADESTLLFVDIENKGREDVRNVLVSVFDTGLMKIVEPITDLCAHAADRLQQSQIESLQCRLVVARPDALINLVTDTQISFRALFQKELRGTVVVNMLSLDEYRRLQTIGELEPESDITAFSDGQLSVRLRFNKVPPFVAGDTVTAQLYVNNIGPGYIGKIEPQRFSIDPQTPVFRCIFDTALYSINGAFTPITCIFSVPQQIPTASSYRATLSLDYDYELRQNVPVSIVKPGQ